MAAAAIAAVLLTPLNIGHLNEPGADLPALAWAACCAALCTGAARRPGLLAPAALAAALAMGAKTTALVPVAVALAAGLYSAGAPCARSVGSCWPGARRLSCWAGSGMRAT